MHLPSLRGMNRFWPWLAMAIVLMVTAFQLHSQGRSWWCACGQPYPWVSDAQGPHNSQHLLDPYSFTHILHGILLYELLAWTLPRVTPDWRLLIVVSIESLWEVVENSAFVIQRYRATTMALGYEGDTIANSLGDILSCVVGFVLARRLGLWGSVAVCVVTEIVLLVWIHDSLFLNVVMLIYPIDAIKAWQTAR